MIIRLTDIPERSTVRGKVFAFAGDLRTGLREGPSTLVDSIQTAFRTMACISSA
jgi:hypothetical protein